MKSLVYAVTPNNEDDIFNKVMDADIVIKNDPVVISNEIRSILERVRLYIGVEDGKLRTINVLLNFLNNSNVNEFRVRE